MKSGTMSVTEMRILIGLNGTKLMCLILEKDSIRTITHVDIVVYKVVIRRVHTIKQAFCGFMHSETYYSALYNDFDYEKDVMYFGELRQTNSLYSGNRTVEQGFHSYARLEDAICIAECYYTVVKCIIPAGAEFYKGHGIDGTPQYASNKIVVKEEINKSPFTLLSK